MTCRQWTCSNEGSMEGMSLYSLLDVEYGASNEEIRSAFRALSKKHHPDHGGSSEYFRQVSEAYGTLGDPQRRRRYDRIFKPLPARKAKSPKPTSSIIDAESIEFRCRLCRRTQPLHRRVARFVCAGCEIAYRFAQCPRCKMTCQVRESLTSWTCSSCQQTTISAWIRLERLKCGVCTTRVTYPRGIKRFSCPKCATRYTRCPKCERCVSPNADIAKKKVKCPHCRKRFAR
jgi:hypothetical protein